MSHAETDAYWMTEALRLAQQAGEAGEVPIGAVLVRDGECLGRGFNQPLSSKDPTAHAEIVALRQAARRLGNYRLPGTSLYVTIEPCTMCFGAIVHARVETLIFGAREPRHGAVLSTSALLREGSFNHYPQCREGVQAEACAALIQDFFRQRRS